MSIVEAKYSTCTSLSLTLTVVISSLVNKLFADLALLKFGVRGESSIMSRSVFTLMQYKYIKGVIYLAFLEVNALFSPTFLPPLSTETLIY